MELFLKRTRGSITVMVTLILIPTVFFTGFLVDLARIKLYGNQALMTADNYGEAVISDYDNLLKELYGLFAVSQNKEGTEALKELEGYMATSFQPNKNTISSQNFQAAQEKWGWNTHYDGFMPYAQAEVEVSYEPVSGANLGNEKIITTQIGDFMKFRIAQQLTDDGEEILDAVGEVENTADEAEVINAKTKLDDEAGKVLEKAGDYYEVLRDINAYPGYLTEINAQYERTKTAYKRIAESEHYGIYYDYWTHKDEIDAARNKASHLKEREHLSSREEEYIRMGERYDEDDEAREDKLREKFDEAAEAYKRGAESSPVDFDNYAELAGQLKERSEKVKKEIGTLQSLKNELESLMDQKEIDKDLRTGIQNDLERMEELFGNAGSYSADNYVNLAVEKAEKNIPVNTSYKEQHQEIYGSLQEIRDEYLECRDSITEFKAPLDQTLYLDFQKTEKYRILYSSLDQCFSGEGDSSKYKKKRDEAKAELKEKENKIREDESTSARDIPSSFGFADGEAGGNFALSNMIQEAVSYFKLNSVGEAGNKLLLKYYMISYDFGMFSSRITNIENGEKAEKEAVSLTGVKMGPEVNYLYGAELEYLLGGNNSSVKNLNLSRNRILAFRAVSNMRATYKVREINEPIKAIKDACSGINPVLGIAVAAALRSAVAGIETYQDWEELKKGNSVVLIKNSVDDLTSYGEIKNLLSGEGAAGGASGGGEKKFKMNYEQYLMVMAIFLTTSEQAARRTGNLITLNVNTVKSKVGTGGTLSELNWKLSDAVTAVDATCAVHLDFVVMPDYFAQQMTSGSTYEELKNFEKNTYKFTVTRGY